MNHFCTCGHLPKEHHMDFGRCDSEELDESGWPCTCPLFEKDSDD